MPAMEDAGEGPAKRRKRDASGLKSGDRISYINRCAVVQDDLRLKETQTRDGGQKKANPSSNWRDLRPGEERYGKIWENLEQFAWEGPKPKETGKGDRLRSLKIDRNDGKGPVELFPARKKDPQDAKAPGTALLQRTGRSRLPAVCLVSSNCAGQLEDSHLTECAHSLRMCTLHGMHACHADDASSGQAACGERHQAGGRSRSQAAAPWRHERRRGRQR